LLLIGVVWNLLITFGEESPRAPGRIVRNRGRYKKISTLPKATIRVAVVAVNMIKA
jgi:hypothetical protein